MSVIELQHVAKSYRTVKALDDLCLDVPEGSIFGLMGPNGAGKTTSIKLMLGLMKPDAGSVAVLGETPGSDTVELRRRLGFVPEDFALYSAMTGEEILAFNAALYHCSTAGKVADLQKIFDLPLKRRISGYSKGMRKLLALYIALSTEPELLILDEPTDGLDPVVRSRFLGVLADETAGRNLTVLLSSHILSEVEKICDTVAFIRGGRSLLQDEVESLKTGYRVYTVRIARDIPAAELRDPAIHRSRKTGPDTWDIEMYASEDAARRIVDRMGGSILNIQNLSFEDIFMRFMEA